MPAYSKEAYTERANIIKALGHPVRLFFVDELAKGEQCVCDLRDMVGLDISTVSKHLLVLKNAGVVVDDKRGKQVFYSLKVPCVTNFFSCVESVIAENTTRTISPYKK